MLTSKGLVCSKEAVKMKKINNLIITMVFVPSISLFAQTTEIVINSGNSVFVPNGAEICADQITVNSGGSYTTEVLSGTCAGANVSGDGMISLPVELTSFTANVSGNNVLLEWVTATEVDNYGFEIEKQIVSKSASGGAVDNWQRIGFVEGHGNSNSPKQYSYTDKNPLGGSVFLYRLKQIDNDGSYEYSDEIEVEIIPVEFALYQNYPNPFNPTTKIRYQLPRESKVIIKLYDILGAEVITLLNEKKEAGVYEVEFSAIGGAAHLTSGTYIYRIIADGFIDTKKMILIK